MSAKTGIEWCDSTWSPIRARVLPMAAMIARVQGYTSLVQIAEKMAGRVGQHCEHVSPGCEYCYAETNNHRCLPGNGTGLPYDRRSRDLIETFLDEKALLLPLKWKPVRDTVWGPEGVPVGVHDRPRRIFVENQSDLFGEWVPDELIDRVFAVMSLCPQHIFQILTKRPERMFDYFTKFGTASLEVRWALIGQHFPSIAPSCGPVYKSSGLPLPNVWLGVSAENQETANRRIPLLLQTPAAMRFLSAEPLLGPLDLEHILYRDDDVDCLWNSLTAYHEVLNSTSMDIVATADDGVTKLDWVICGGESGPGARPMHPDWARLLRDQCAAAGVAFFFKQWGAYKNGSDFKPDAIAVLGDGRICDGTVGQLTELDRQAPVFGATLMRRVGKKAAGSLLDDREHKAFPVPR